MPIPTAVDDLDALPLVTITPKARPRARVDVGGTVYVVTKPKQLAGVRLWERLGEVEDLVLSADPADRERAIALIREFSTLIFSKAGHVDGACDCDSCQVFARLLDDADPLDVDDITDGLSNLGEHWGLSKPRAERRAEARAMAARKPKKRK